MRTDIISFACAAAILAACYTAPCHAQAGSSAGQTASSDTSAAVQAASGLDEKIMGPSPQASTFLKYGEYPVSLYTGLVDITIPIYTIEQNGITVPIAFKYHASGLKYDDVSMEVGLGWALMAGGVVTRAIRGVEDGNHRPTFIKHVDNIVTHEGTTYITDDYVRIRKVANGYKEFGDWSLKEDGEIDLWNFSFLSHSGTYCFPPHESHPQVGGPDTFYGLFIPNNGMQALDHFHPKLRDTEGITYTFDAFDPESKSGSREFFLTEIVSADRADTIRLIYDHLREKIKRRFINSTYSIYSTHSFIYTGVTRETEYDGGMFYSYSSPPRLRRIEFRGGRVEFEYKNINGYPTWNLQTIKIYTQKQIEPLQTVVLNKGKFKNGEDRLERISFTDSQNHSYDYQFGYNGEPWDMKFENQSGIDFWGYFNGAFTPHGRFVPTFPDHDISGSDRSPNEKYMQGGILNKIIYPTKGYTEFEYEPHKVVRPTGIVDMYGGLRLKVLRNYLANNQLAEKRWYAYGENESGGGISKGIPDLADFSHQEITLTTTGKEDFPNSYTHPAEKTNTYIYSSFPKRNKLISGSSVVYPAVTEYIGSETETLGKTIYEYEVILNEETTPSDDGFRLNTRDMPFRDYSWKTGNLKSKKIYKTENGIHRCIYSLENKYQDIKTEEYLNLRVAQYVKFVYTPANVTYYDVLTNFCRYSAYYQHFDSTNRNDTPYNYFNYYTTTGLRVLKSSEEMTDGVTKLTEYTYNATGLPASVTETFSTGDRKITHNKFTTDVTGYEAMVEENMLSPLIEQRIYHNDSLTSFDKTIYSNAVSTNMHLYAPRERVVEKYDASGTQTRKVTYHKYDRYGNPHSLTRADGLSVVYLWSYASLYPVMQIQNATYEQVVQALGAGTIEALASQYPTAATLQSYATKLQTALENSLITIHTYKPLVGVTSITDPAGRSTSYEYGGFGRLEKVLDEQGNPLQTYEYNYRK